MADAWVKTYVDVLRVGTGERCKLDGFLPMEFTGLDRIGIRRDLVTLRRDNGDCFGVSSWMFALGAFRFVAARESKAKAA